MWPIAVTSQYQKPGWSWTNYAGYLSIYAPVPSPTNDDNYSQQLLLNGQADAALLDAPCNPYITGTTYTCSQVDDLQISEANGQVPPKHLLTLSQTDDTSSNLNTTKNITQDLVNFLYHTNTSPWPNFGPNIGQGDLTNGGLFTYLSQAPYVPCEWDVNADGTANVLDEVDIGNNWGKTGPVYGWLREDVSFNGVVDLGRS